MRALQGSRVRHSNAGNAVFNACEGDIDDLVLALALAVLGLPQRVRACDYESHLGESSASAC